MVPENVRVEVSLLDDLVDLAGELVLTRNHIVQLSKSREDPALATATQRLNFVTAQLQDGIMRMRMQPVSTLFSRFPRVVRDLARSCRKLVHLEVDARDTELDKSLIETIKDPLVHLLRNCVDHGIEAPEVRSARGKHAEGRIVLRAYHQNGLVHIEVADDGGGISIDKVRAKGIERGVVSEERAASMSDSEIAGLIFQPGFSTADQVTNVSGRGVGMDVVKTNVERVGGTVDVDTKLGFGTTFTLKSPLTLAIVPALIVRCAEARYAIPQVNVIELVRLNGSKQALEWIHGAPVYRLRGKLLPVVFLEEALGGHLAPTPANDTDDEINLPGRFLAVLQCPGRQFCLAVDEVLDQQEIVVKPLPKLLAETGAYAGATLLGDGRVALILDILGIAQRAQLTSEVHDDIGFQRAGLTSERSTGQRTLLLLQGPDDARLAVALDQVSRLETIDLDTIESGGSHHVVQYRGEIMPLLRASEILPERRTRPRSDATPQPENLKTLSVVVLGKAGRSMGLVVDDVLDVVEASGELRRLGCRAGIARNAGRARPRHRSARPRVDHQRGRTRPRIRDPRSRLKHGIFVHVRCGHAVHRDRDRPHPGNPAPAACHARTARTLVDSRADESARPDRPGHRPRATLGCATARAGRQRVQRIDPHAGRTRELARRSDRRCRRGLIGQLRARARHHAQLDAFADQGRLQTRAQAAARTGPERRHPDRLLGGRRNTPCWRT